MWITLRLVGWDFDMTNTQHFYLSNSSHQSSTLEWAFEECKSHPYITSIHQFKDKLKCKISLGICEVIEIYHLGILYWVDSTF
jgi:hypothetical protein